MSGFPDGGFSFNPRAPRGARLCSQGKRCYSKVSIHAPRAGRDDVLPDWPMEPHVSIHAPRAGRDKVTCLHQRHSYVSIHAPRAGRDAKHGRKRRPGELFQSTRPARGATCDSRPVDDSHMVSIHAPRAGRDAMLHSSERQHLRFNPRAPRGARLSRRGVWSRCPCFNPRAPRGARRSAWR